MLGDVVKKFDVTHAGLIKHQLRAEGHCPQVNRYFMLPLAKFVDRCAAMTTSKRFCCFWNMATVMAVMYRFMRR